MKNILLHHDYLQAVLFIEIHTGHTPNLNGTKPPLHKDALYSLRLILVLDVLMLYIICIVL